MSTLAVPAQRAQAPVPIQRHTADTPWTLVERAQAGDMDAWAQIWRANYDRVYRFVWWRVRNHATTEDLTSEVFTKALARIGSVDWRGRDIGAWLTTVARNLLADYYKCGPGKREFAHDDFTGADEAEPDTAAAAAEHNELAATLHAALATITREQADCLRLRFLRGLSVEETARAMGINDGAVKSLQYRAVRALARIPEVLALRGDR